MTTYVAFRRICDVIRRFLSNLEVSNNVVFKNEYHKNSEKLPFFTCCFQDYSALNRPILSLCCLEIGLAQNVIKLMIERGAEVFNQFVHKKGAVPFCVDAVADRFHL